MFFLKAEDFVQIAILNFWIKHITTKSHILTIRVFIQHSANIVVTSRVSQLTSSMSSTPVSAMTPVRVSPLIRFARWTLLLTGIWYGSTRWNYLHRKEEKYRDYLREMKPVWDAEAAAKKKEEERKQMEELKAQGIDIGG